MLFSTRRRRRSDVLMPSSITGRAIPAPSWSATNAPAFKSPAAPRVTRPRTGLRTFGQS